MINTECPTRGRASNRAISVLGCLLALLGIVLIWGPSEGSNTLLSVAASESNAGFGSGRKQSHFAPEGRAIQDVKVGDRVLTRASDLEPDLRSAAGVLPASEPSLDAEEVDEATWRRVDLSMPEGPGGDLEITLLRPSWWVDAAGARAGGTVRLNLPEMGVEGVARVDAIGRCPAIKPGKGRVVTGTFTHSGATVLDVVVEGVSGPTGATPRHPFYSVSRGRFVAAEELGV